MSPRGAAPSCVAQRIRAFVVVAENQIQATGHIDIPAPLGIRVDRLSGDLTPAIAIQPVKMPAVQGMVINGKVILEGFVRAKLTWISLACEEQSGLFVIPFEAVLDLDCVQHDDEVIPRAEVDALLVSGLPEQGERASRILLKAIVALEVITGHRQVIHCCCRPPDMDHPRAPTTPGWRW